MTTCSTNGSSYYLTAASANSLDPPTHPSDWIEVTAAGATGATGPAGATGSSGVNGQAATISVGTVTTGAAGPSASVTNSGTSTAAVFNFTIPQGQTGAAGGGLAVDTTPLTNGATITGTSSEIYFITDAATVTLPAANTAGQHLILINHTLTDTSVGITIRPGGSDTLWSTEAEATEASYFTLDYMELYSAGNGNWYLINTN